METRQQSYTPYSLPILMTLNHNTHCLNVDHFILLDVLWKLEALLKIRAF